MSNINPPKMSAPAFSVGSKGDGGGNGGGGMYFGQQHQEPEEDEFSWSQSQYRGYDPDPFNIPFVTPMLNFVSSTLTRWKEVLAKQLYGQ